jgi:Helix-turn-helix domain
VGIGGALAAARSEAGLTITEVSQRTRIRETIIRDIERDDYTACGGDYYARGHIRAIARAVGTDPAPLIEEYDAVHMPPPPEPDLQNGTGAGHSEGAGWRVPGWARRPHAGFNGNGAAGYPAVSHPAAQPDDTAPLAPAPLVPPTAARQTGPSQYGISAAEAFRPSMPLEHLRTRRRPNLTAILAAIVLVVVGVLIYLLVAGGSSQSNSPAKASSHHTTGPTTRATTHPSTQASGSPTSTAVGSAPAPLRIATAAAFGPGGTAHGDDPSMASRAIDGSSSTYWQTDWYATSHFGGLQSGTGLLLDMGSPVSVTSAQITLGPSAGGSLELLAGSTPVLADLHVVATARNSGGTQTIQVTSPVTGRYLLVWFTSLPPDSTGTYQATVSNVKLSGTS